MGRKIPGRKHRGVKNPYEQQAQRDASQKVKINAAPLDPEGQAIPQSVLHIMKLKQSVKASQFKGKKKRKNRNKSGLINTQRMAQRDLRLPGMTRPDKPAPEFVQRPGESNNHFLYRIELSCQEVLNENSFEDKFGVDVQRDAITGEVTSVVKKAKDQIREMEKEAEMSGKGKRRAKKKQKERLSKGEKRKQKLQARKEAKLQDAEEDEGFDRFRDEVIFGEVVHAPPALEAPLRMKARIKSSGGRPGSKDLLLKPLLQAAPRTQPKLHLPTTSVFTGKRRDIPVAERRQLEKKRLEVVDAYRTLKARQAHKTRV